MTTPNNEYDAGTFQSLADTDLGRNLWQFLNEDLIVACMGTATSAWSQTGRQTGQQDPGAHRRGTPQALAPRHLGGRQVARAGDRNVRWRTHGKAGETLEVSEWPGGLAPVWSLLEPQSEEALRSEPSPENGALSFASDVEDEALAQSVFVRNALVLLEAMDGKETMWISSGSNCLMKKCVTRLRGLISWPGLEGTEHFRKGKTYREQDVGELHLLRLLVERAGLIRSAGLWFELTPLGRALLEPGRRGTLQALLFRHAFWDMDLSRFVRVHPRGLPGWWPQGEIGVILWSLSAVAEDWQNAGALTALCTIPDDELPETRRGAASTMFVWRILWPLRWFGLLEYRGPEETRDVAWRKSVLFDRFLSFDVRLSDNRGSSH